MSKHLLQVREDQRRGAARGVYAVCSAHPLVLQASLEQALEDRSHLLIEATCNQVDQFGGYTGMTPSDFMAFIHGLADQNGFPKDRLILGGDHLGPNPWKNEPSASAMEKAEDLVEAYVRAGFRKIHLDASMRCADDPRILPDTTIAQRAAALCLRAEQTYAASQDGPPPVYVIGTEVPPPGGAKDEEETLKPSTPQDVERTLEISHAAFQEKGLHAAWERVIALVVQPGVEFGDAVVHDYNRVPAAPLALTIMNRAPWMYEAHSTDYQRPGALARLVEDHFAILKVGPWLTFACREALFALEDIAREMHAVRPSHPMPQLRAALDAAMLRNSVHWKSHYHGTPDEQAFARRFSFSDRSRYYWGETDVNAEVQRLLQATQGPLPLQLLSQYCPLQYEAVRAGTLRPDGRSIVIHAVRHVLGFYSAACRTQPQPSEGSL